MPLHTELWFPSPIWSGIKHEIDNNALKSFAYDKRKQDPGVHISNYRGWQSNPLARHENMSLDNLIDMLNREIHDITVQTGMPRLELYNIWININPPGGYNTLHDHFGAVFSGVYYVEANENQGNIVFERDDNAQFFIPPVHQKNYFNSTACTYKAKTGALYVFPGWLKHRVDPNESNTDRISISFNYGVVNAS